MMQRPKITRTAVAMQKIEYEPRISEVVWGIVIFFVAHTSEIWGKPVLLRIGPTYTLKICDGMLM